MKQGCTGLNRRTKPLLKVTAYTTMSSSFFVCAAIKIRSTGKDCKMSCVRLQMCVYREEKGQYEREMEKTKPPGHSRPSARCKASRQEKKEEIVREGVGRCAPQGRATLKGRERWVIVCAVNEGRCRI